ncbi:MAG: histidine kinase [Saprospiraceae bacterium]|nr:histidine kinase [Saprospiraceae bacterium]
MKKLNDKKIRLYGIPILSIILAGTMWVWEPDIAVMSFWLHFVVVLIDDTLGWIACRSTLIFFRGKYPSIAETRRRIAWSLASYVVITALFVLWHVGLLNTFLLPEGTDVGVVYWMKEFGLAIVCVVFLAGIYEAQYFFEQWTDHERTTKQLEFKVMNSHIEALKNQISPHFLFNSLNSLSSLIRSDPDEAEVFLDEMSDIYRYLLRKNSRRLVTLQEELEFAQSYLQLLKKRYGMGLHCELNISEGYHQHLLPPLTLQLLIENAVKHNVVSRSSPLYIRIFTDEMGKLTVANNLQEKKIAVESNKVGLSNISANYKLLNQPDIVIEKTDQTFRVILNLIEDPDANLYDHVLGLETK